MSATPPSAGTDGALRLDVLLEGQHGPDDLPTGLRDRYGGPLGLDRPCVYANFVTSVDGVVALEMTHSPAVISRRSEADRFVMGLLRARADAVLVGGATMRADPGHRWTASHIYPDAADDFAELRRRNGQAENPRLVVLTASGALDTDEPALEGALVVTTREGERALAGRVPASATVRGLERVTADAVIGSLRDEGLGLVLSEAGPQVFGQLVAARCLDELFLTTSPVLAGSAAPGRRTLSAGTALDPDDLADMELVSLRRAGSHLFARYRRAG